MKNANTDGKNLKPLSNLGEIRAVWHNKQDEGSCNFCKDNPYRKVLVISGCGVQVRMCRNCFNSVKRQGNQ
jgi:hypothetical protein